MARFCMITLQCKHICTRFIYPLVWCKTMWHWYSVPERSEVLTQQIVHLLVCFIVVCFIGAMSYRRCCVGVVSSSHVCLWSVVKVHSCRDTLSVTHSGVSASGARCLYRVCLGTYYRHLLFTHLSILSYFKGYSENIFYIQSLKSEKMVFWDALRPKVCFM